MELKQLKELKKCLQELKESNTGGWNSSEFDQAIEMINKDIVLLEASKQTLIMFQKDEKKIPYFKGYKPQSYFNIK